MSTGRVENPLPHLLSHEADDELRHGVHVLGQAADERLDAGSESGPLVQLGRERVGLLLRGDGVGEQQPHQGLGRRLTGIHGALERRQLLLQLGDAVPAEADALCDTTNGQASECAHSHRPNPSP